ncbi:class I SAM-dependent methyltransferase [Tistrella sp. BH-R2-4]|uniref:Ubiquinone/menaquinone biosynthesis C-methyltransferase UbiE n=1 Tax=Tistrella arctica TaxID=3133430 RepID=A0ABU9YGA0_9PROT
MPVPDPRHSRPDGVQPARPRDDAGDARPADFGFRTVTVGDKRRMVRGVFDSVATRYDLMNDLMSGGIHRLWKDAMMDWLAPRPGQHLLDVAGGTGDIAFRFIDRSRRNGGRTPAGTAAPTRVTVCDLTPAMLAVGRDRGVDRGLVDGLDWVAGNAETLPVASSSVDVYTIAFGIRNVADIPAALAEARRVLKPGGRFMCLEFSQVQAPVLDRLYDLYSFSILPRIGQVVARDAASYRYLAESIRKFPTADRFAAMIAEAGLRQVKVRLLSGGIAALHSAWKV